MLPRIPNRLGCLLLLFTWASMGCQLMNGVKLATIPEATAEHPVVEIICVWQPGEGTGMDGLPCRGFAGQILFFAMGEKPPVRIDGKVRVYVFDDQGTEAEQEVPIHQFDFDSSAFNNFLTNTNLGAAYQLFIPYTRKGTHSANCALRVRFTPEEGSSVYSKMATIILPGTTERKPDEPIEPPVSKASRDAQVVAELLQPVQRKQTSTDSQITLANAQEEIPEQAAVQNEQKRRLRSTLSEIASVNPPAKETTAAEEPGRAAIEQKSPSFKLHPLADAAPSTSDKAVHPLLQEAEATAESEKQAATPSKPPATTATDAEKPAAEAPAEKAVTPAPESETSPPPAEPRHPLLDD